MSDQTTRLLLDQAQREIVKLESRLREAEEAHKGCDLNNEAALSHVSAERDRLQKLVNDHFVWNPGDDEPMCPAETERDRLRKAEEGERVWKAYARDSDAERDRLRKELDTETTTTYALNEQVWALMKERDRLREAVDDGLMYGHDGRYWYERTQERNAECDRLLEIVNHLDCEYDHAEVTRLREMVSKQADTIRTHLGCVPAHDCKYLEEAGESKSTMKRKAIQRAGRG